MLLNLASTRNTGVGTAVYMDGCLHSNSIRLPVHTVDLNLISAGSSLSFLKEEKFCNLQTSGKWEEN